MLIVVVLFFAEAKIAVDLGSNKETQKLNEEWDLGVGFGDIFKASSHILYIVS